MGSPESRGEVARDLERVTDRLRSLSQARLAAPGPPYASRADAARRAAQKLADAAAGVEGRTAERPPAPRALPPLDDLQVGEQVAVTGHDLLLALDGVPDDEPVWAAGGRRTAREAVTEAADTLAALRRLL